MRPVTAVLLAALSLGSVPKLDTVVEVRSDLEGDWAWQTTLYIGGCGNDLPRRRGPQPDLRIRGHTMSGWADTEWDATFRRIPAANRCVSAVTFKALDVVFANGAGHRARRRGYYKLVGRDELHIFLANPDQPRAELCERFIFTRTRR